MTTAAAIGFRAHSGWAAAVAVTGSAHAVAITRRRIEMGDAQPYHAAARLDIAEARELVERCAARAASMAAEALRGLIGDLHRLGHEVTGCGLLLASGRPLPELESILRSHALIHTAEGEHFRNALRAAVRQRGLPLVTLKERDVEIAPHIAAMGKAVGPPWGQDQKLAATAAWQVLCRR
ncbi:MAG TPA: hypothetical protein VMI94_05470 [Bryobacteraceae bacterium]|nr:hypothetical protein [Bryobacteraceae bacterium]